MSVNIYTAAGLKKVAGSGFMDAELNENSNNGVKNSVLKTKLDEQDEAINQINTDLLNLKMFPDYSATPLHTFTASDSWTATENCYIIGSFRHTHSGMSAMYVDDVPVAVCWGQTGGIDTANVQLMVKKGSVVTTNSLVGVSGTAPLPSAYPLTN